MAFPIIILQSMFNLGGALIAARLADKVRDIENLLPFVFRLLFYASGVLFLADRFIPDLGDPTLEATFRTLFIANPLYSFLSLMRHYSMTSISQEHVGLMWLSACVWSLAAFIIGLVFFRAGESTYGRG